MIPIALFLVAALGEIYEGIRENPGDLLLCSQGDTVTELSVSIFADSYWEETQRLEFCLAEDSLFILVFQWPGNGACLTTFSRAGDGYCMTGEFTSLFGGNGIDFVVSDAVHNSMNEVEFRLDLTGYLRGYYPDPDIPSTYVEASEYQSWIIFAADDDSLHVLSSSL